MNPSLTAIRNALNVTSYVAPRLAGAYAFSLYSYPRRRDKVRADERAVVERAVVEPLDVDGAKIATYRWGDGERPVLFVHGYQSRASNFARFVDGIQERGMTALAYDAPGHGDSEGTVTTILTHRRVMTLLQERHGPFQAVIAHSFGATCSYWALRNGLRAGQFVSIGAVADFGYLPDAFCERLGLRSAIARDLRRRTEKYLKVPDLWRRLSPRDRPEEIAIPILVVHDDTDQEVPVEHARQIAASYGDRARLFVTHGLGHRRPLRDPEVIETVLAFIGEAERVP